jgi:hypothetical protein
MPISITGTGTITGISAGGLPDDCITTAEIAGSAVTPAKLSGAQSGSAPIYGARAWVNFDGTRNEADTGASTDGANVKIRASGNVSSVLKNSTGDYTVNFTIAMANANYATITSYRFPSSGDQNASLSCPVNGTAPTTTQIRMKLANAYGGGSGLDTDFLSVSIFS